MKKSFIILLLCVTQLCHAQYTGGGGNGNEGSFTAAVFMGAGSNRFAGGAGDGFNGLTAAAVLMGAGSNGYAGGNGDGFYGVTSPAIALGAGSNGYAGGSGDGFHGLSATGILMGAGSNGYAGGNGDGFTTALSATQPLIIANTRFTGGSGDGFSSASAIRSYTFIGTGNWDLNTNWQYFTIPPPSLPANFEIIINPAGSTECILNTPQTILPGAKMTIMAGKTLRILGNLLIQ